MAATSSRGRQPPARPRAVVPAILLNFFGAGAGYLYLGRPRRALLLALWSLLGLAVWFTPLGRVMAAPAGMVAVLTAALVGIVVMLIDTARLARSAGVYVRRWYNRASIYVLAVLGFFLAGSADLLSDGDVRAAVKSFHVPSRSMEPALLLGDRFIADMYAYRAGRSPSRGDVIVFRDPRQPGTMFVKRVIGLPGERVRITDGVVYVDDAAVPTSDAGYVRVDADPGATANAPRQRVVRLRKELLPGGQAVLVRAADPKAPHGTVPEVAVPPGHWFVLGDNRGNSVDSRLPVERGGIGLVPRALLEGRAAWTFWSADPSRIGGRL